MKTTTAVVSQLLLVAGVLAAPPANLRERLLAARKTPGISSLPRLPFEAPQPEHEEFTSKLADSGVTTDYNWAGSSVGPPASGSSYASVIGTWTIPEVSTPAAGDGTYGLYSWVGIDGITGSGGLWQSGIWQEFTVSGGAVTFSETIPWYCWFPTSCVYFDGLTTNVGDSVTVEVIVDTTSTGTVHFDNNSSGQSVSFDVTSASSNLDLDGANAEWIVEDTAIQGVPLPAFSTVVFTDCSATLNTGEVDNTNSAGSTVWQVINQSTNNMDLTASIDSDSQVTVYYNV